MNIGIIGVGKLGLSLAVLIEKAGFNVMASDVVEEYVNALNNKTFTSNEPFVTDYLQNASKFSVTTNNDEVINYSDIIFIVVATPSTDDGTYDIDTIKTILTDSKKLSIKNKTIVIVSTTNPGDCETFESILNGTEANLLYNPEFIAQGSIIENLKQPDMILIGGRSNDSAQSLLNIYNSFVTNTPKISVMSFRSAEITKIAINCFLTFKISFANLIGQYLIKNNLYNEIETVLLAIGNDSRIGRKFLNYGFGFGGPCLPRDNKAFGNALQKNGNFDNFAKIIDDFNFNHLNFLKLYHIEQNINLLPFYFEYVSYKKDTDIFEESHQLKLCELLLQENYKVYIKDTHYVTPQIKEYLEKYSTVRFVVDVTEPVYTVI